ncbi:bis(5'-nucleosyl)-tetraphosphatase (symmetrical) YqeK [Paenibacillus sp. y28]|uniref:bis(5'-nucleosyl)-tetraphosphatase (symmetrical) YqeK n=1 Tax=Paenibacillus sp. y28 TaxID=3129110 RepID=UPI00301A8627
MDRNELMRLTREQMPERRWTHTVGVMETAVVLAERFGGDTEKADLAALLHDYCKFWPMERQIRTAVESGIAGDMLDYDPQLLHAPLGAWIAEHELGVGDTAVLAAIRYHTSGRIGMTQLDKIICLADYMEPGRDFPGVDLIRKLAETSLEQALVAGFDSTILFLLQKGKKVYPLTLLARNHLLDELKASRG